MVKVFWLINVNNDLLRGLIVTLFCWLGGSIAVSGQGIAPELRADVDAAITLSSTLRNRAQPDSARLILLSTEQLLDSLGYRDSPLFRKLQLEQCINYAKKGSYLLALKKTNTVATTSCEQEEWQNCAAAQLQLADLNLSVGNSADSQTHLWRASSLIRSKKLSNLISREQYQYANWQANFGYQDSVHYYLDAFFRQPAAPLSLQASANKMYAQYAVDRTVLQDSMYREAASLYAKLGNYPNAASALTSLALVYQRAGKVEHVLPLLNKAEEYGKKGRQRGQEVERTLANTYDVKGTYYRTQNQPDSALFFVEKGLRREVIYWQSAARIKAAQARELYRNEQQEQQLAARGKQLRIERLRSYGLIGFAIIIVLSSLWTIRLYQKLKVVNQLTRKQADELETSNQDLIAAKEQLEDALSLQKMLKVELQHRVKNNMQLILSIFNLSRDTVADPGLQQMLQTQQEQVRSIVLLHQNIDLKSNEREIDPTAYLGEIVSNLKRSYAGIYPDVNLRLEFSVDLIHIDSAIPVGLILNELITNAYKYAFPKKGSGNIYITFTKHPDHFCLRVADDGAGLPENFLARRSGSVGTRLIKGFARQLQGTVEWVDAQPGTVVELKFSAYSNAIV